MRFTRPVFVRRHHYCRRLGIERTNCRIYRLLASLLEGERILALRKSVYMSEEPSNVRPPYPDRRLLLKGIGVALTIAIPFWAIVAVILYRIFH